jgi:hypothetical protein
MVQSAPLEYFPLPSSVAFFVLFFVPFGLPLGLASPSTSFRPDAEDGAERDAGGEAALAACRFSSHAMSVAGVMTYNAHA